MAFLNAMFNIVFGLAFSLVFTYFFIWLARVIKFVDDPDGILKTQSGSVAYLGGAALLCTVIVGIITNCWFNSWNDLDQLILFVCTVVPFFLIGIIDDMVRLSAQNKFFLQLLATIYVVYLFGGIFWPILQIIFLCFLILLMVNAFNLIDVSDGLLGSVCIPIFVVLAILATVAKLFFSGVLAQIFIGALLGFLYYNWQPAKIYLGDAGSLFLGSSVVFLLMSFMPVIVLPTLFLLSTCLVGVALAEVAGLVVIRSYLRKPFYVGSPHHFSIYLKKQGFSASQVAAFSGVSSLILGAVSLSLFLNLVQVLPALIFLGIGFSGWCYIIYYKDFLIKKILQSFKIY